MIHIVLHLAAPLLIGLAFYRPKWRGVALILLSTMVVDVDHLLADPVYDPNRCSIGFHPLHTTPAIALYVALAATPLVWNPIVNATGASSVVRTVHLIGLGLLIHMALDLGDCML